MSDLMFGYLENIYYVCTTNRVIIRLEGGGVLRQVYICDFDTYSDDV